MAPHEADCGFLHSWLAFRFPGYLTVFRHIADVTCGGVERSPPTFWRFPNQADIQASKLRIPARKQLRVQVIKAGGGREASPRPIQDKVGFEQQTRYSIISVGIARGRRR